MLLSFSLALGFCAQISPQMAEIIPQSSLKLIARPDLYEKKVVTVVGVMGQDISDGFCLYIDKSSQTERISQNCVKLAIPLERSETARKNFGQYVIVSGVFTEYSYRGIWPGSMSKITRIDRYPEIRDFPDSLEP
jgi:hypothetical protein